MIIYKQVCILEKHNYKKLNILIEKILSYQYEMKILSYQYEMYVAIH